MNAPIGKGAPAKADAPFFAIIYLRRRMSTSVVTMPASSSTSTMPTAISTPLTPPPPSASEGVLSESDAESVRDGEADELDTLELPEEDAPDDELPEELEDDEDADDEDELELLELDDARCTRSVVWA